MKEPTKVICCICDRVTVETQGTYSLPYESEGEEGALFICNDCQSQENHAFPGYPVDWEDEEDEDNSYCSESDHS